MATASSEIWGLDLQPQPAVGVHLWTAGVGPRRQVGSFRSEVHMSRRSGTEHGRILARLTPRVGRLTIAAVAGILGLTLVGTLHAQKECTATLAIYCGGKIYCTTDPGSNCTSCPRK